MAKRSQFLLAKGLAKVVTKNANGTALYKIIYHYLSFIMILTNPAPYSHEGQCLEIIDPHIFHDSFHLGLFFGYGLCFPEI